MLFRRVTLDAIATGDITLAFRRWDRARLLPGSRLRTAVGVLEVGSIDVVADQDVTDADARAAGFADASALLSAFPGDRPLFRVSLCVAGPDPRLELRSRDALTEEERADLATRLDRMDRASRTGPWTATVLGSIADNPGVRATDLAARLGRETLPFKRDVRKLKELGLTESLEVGYRLSPRGQAWLGTHR